MHVPRRKFRKNANVDAGAECPGDLQGFPWWACLHCYDKLGATLNVNRQGCPHSASAAKLWSPDLPEPFTRRCPLHYINTNRRTALVMDVALAGIPTGATK